MCVQSAHGAVIILSILLHGFVVLVVLSVQRFKKQIVVFCDLLLIILSLGYFVTHYKYTRVGNTYVCNLKRVLTYSMSLLRSCAGESPKT